VATIDRNKYVARRLSVGSGHAMEKFKRLFGPDERYRAGCTAPGCDGYMIVGTGFLEGRTLGEPCPIQEPTYRCASCGRPLKADLPHSCALG
jgi:hypothetical protein